MPRLFTGLEIPPDIAAQLAFFRGGLPGARWIEPSDYHVTLRFLGDVDNIVANDVHEALLTMRPRPPLNVTLDGIAVFGGTAPRAIFASVAGDAALVELQAEHERIARRAGLAPEKRKFTPHVTLARLKRRTSADDVAASLSEMGVFPCLTFTAERVALFSARESQGGGPYVVETSYALAEPSPEA